MSLSASIYANDTNKGWINLNANSLDTNSLIVTGSATIGSLITGSIDAGQIVSSAQVRNNFTGGTLSPTDLITGVLGINKSVTPGSTDIQIITLPSGGALDAALSQFTPPFYFTTQIYATYTGVTSNAAPTTQIIRFNLSGITAYNGTSPFDLVTYWLAGGNAPADPRTQVQRTLTFSRSLSGWTFYA